MTDAQKSAFVGFLLLTEYVEPTTGEQKIILCRPSGQSRENYGTALCFFQDKLFGGRKLMKKVGIIMGSDSDLPIVEKAITTLAELEIPYEVHIYSAHRTPVEARDFSMNAREKGFGAIIAAAGKAAHLAGAIAANTTIPVIGIPIKSSTLDGLDALLSTVQMPGGIPVATVAIDGAQNAALLAAQILSVSDEDLAKRLDAQRKAAMEAVLEKNRQVAEKYNG